jgi:hypothetical protein
VIPSAFLHRIRRYIAEERERRGGEYSGLDRADGVEDSPLRPVIRHAGLNAAMRGL